MIPNNLLVLLASPFVLGAIISAAIAIPVAIDDGDDGREDYQVEIVYDVDNEINPPEDLQFFGNIISGDPINFHWTWNNGTTISYDQNPIIHFEHTGVYQISFWADNLELGSGMDTVEVETGAEREDPTSNIESIRENGMELPTEPNDISAALGSSGFYVESFPEIGLVNESFFFMARSNRTFDRSYSIYQGMATMFWDFGDGEYYYYDFSDDDTDDDTCPLCYTPGSGAFPSNYHPSSPFWWSIAQTFHEYSDQGNYTVRFVIGYYYQGGILNYSGSVQISVCPNISVEQPGLNDPMELFLEASPNRGFLPLTVEFNASGTGELSDDAVFLWTFGDGTVATSMDPVIEHTFQDIPSWVPRNPLLRDKGNYTVRVVIRENLGRILTDSVSVLVSEFDHPLPYIVPEVIDQPDEMIFYGEVANRKNSLVDYYWVVNGEPMEGKPKFIEPELEMGQNNIHLLVIDEDGYAAHFDIQVIVSDDSRPRIPYFIWEQNPYDPTLVTFEPVVYGGNGPYSYEWDLGDGTYSNEESPTHRYYLSGNYDVVLKVWDNDGDYDELEYRIPIELWEVIG